MAEAARGLADVYTRRLCLHSSSGILRASFPSIRRLAALLASRGTRRRPPNPTRRSSRAELSFDLHQLVEDVAQRQRHLLVAIADQRDVGGHLVLITCDDERIRVERPLDRRCSAVC